MSTPARTSPGTPPALRGPDQVGSELVRLKRSMEAFRVRVHVASGHGLEGAGLGVLHHLTAAGPTRLSRLAELLGIDPSTTSRHVAALERSGHVERVADPDDGRAWLVQASSSGHQAFQQARALRNALLDRVLGGWDPEEVDALAAALGRFNDAVAGLDDRAVDELADLAPRETAAGPTRRAAPPTAASTSASTPTSTSTTRKDRR